MSKIQQIHSFVVPENIVCMISNGDEMAHGFFKNIFENHEDFIARVFVDVSEHGKDDPIELLIGEGMVLSTGVTYDNWWI